MSFRIPAALLAMVMSVSLMAGDASARLLATRSVGFLVDRDAIDINRTLSSIDFDVLDNPIHINSITVHFGDSKGPATQTFKGGHFNAGRSTPRYGWNKRRMVTEIVIFYETVGLQTLSTAHVVVNGY